MGQPKDKEGSLIEASGVMQLQRSINQVTDALSMPNVLGDLLDGASSINESLFNSLTGLMSHDVTGHGEKFLEVLREHLAVGDEMLQQHTAPVDPNTLVADMSFFEINHTSLQTLHAPPQISEGPLTGLNNAPPTGFGDRY